VTTATAGYWAKRGRVDRLGNKGLGILGRIQTKRFKLLNLNSNNQKQCISMNATINSYDLLILF
jgi:hypothetical protein